MKKNITTTILRYFKALHIVAFFAFIIFSSCGTKNVEKPYLLGLGYGIDSSTLFVDDLETTCNYYRDTLGFTIRKETGEDSIEGSRKALIFFADMSILKILSPSDSVPDEEWI